MLDCMIPIIHTFADNLFINKQMKLFNLDDTICFLLGQWVTQQMPCLDLFCFYFLFYLFLFIIAVVDIFFTCI